MATNALAPKPKNAMVRQTDKLQSLLLKSADSPQYGELVDYLSARRMMPPISLKYGSSSSFVFPGTFSNPNKLPSTGVVKIAERETPNAVVHELTHAAQRQIELQYRSLFQKNRKTSLTPIEKQFMQAYEKLVYRPGKLFGAKPETTQTATAKKIAPKWAEEQSDYRATADELAAFGMGSTVDRNEDAPLHIDPSYATEFSILLDMARRLQKSQPVTDLR